MKTDELWEKARGLEPMALWKVLGCDTLDIDSIFGTSIANDLRESTKLGSVTVEMSAMRLLNLASFAMGRHVLLVDGPHETRPLLYTCMVSPSGTSKSPLSKWLYAGNIFKWSAKFIALHDQKMKEIDTRTKTVETKGSTTQKDLTHQEKDRERREMHFNHPSPLIMDATPQGMLLALRGSSCLMFFDEANNFFNTFCPGKPGDSNDFTSLLTQIYTNADSTTNRVDAQIRDVLDANLAIAITGTPEAFRKMLDQGFIESGGMWRYDYCVGEQVEQLETPTLDEVRNSRRERPQACVHINRAITSIFQDGFVRDFSGEMQSEFAAAGVIPADTQVRKQRTRDSKDRYVYSREAQLLKDEASNFYVGWCQKEFLRIGAGRMASMVSKIPERIDKYAMLVHALRLSAGVEKIETDFQSGDVVVSQESIESALDIAGLVIKGWRDMLSLSTVISEEEQKTLTTKKKRIPDLITKMILMHGITDTNQVRDVADFKAGLEAIIKSSDLYEDKAKAKSNMMKLFNKPNDYIKYMDPAKQTFIINVS